MGVLVGGVVISTLAIVGTGGGAAPIIIGTGNTVYVGTSAVAATSSGVGVVAATGAGAGAVAATGAGAGTVGGVAAIGAGAGATGAGAGAAGAGAGAAGAAGILSGPIGWIILGAEETDNKSISFDCWKKIIHDESTEKSKGRFLRNICQDKRIKQIQANNNQFIIENVWNEKFQINFYHYPNCDQFFAHAIPISTCNTCE